ncbi:MAG: hypothetical protein V2J24_23575 [Pseudomonadales bacterium]|jgi:hypothetical protein|nr:hypothetical protein [Pseudomonadales bacterium]
MDTTGQYRATLTSNQTITVRGHGKCIIKVDGGTGNGFGGGTVTVEDDCAGDPGTFTPTRDKDEAQAALVISSSGQWMLPFPLQCHVGVRLTFAGATAPNLHVGVLFERM